MEVKALRGAREISSLQSGVVLLASSILSRNSVSSTPFLGWSYMRACIWSMSVPTFSCVVFHTGTPCIFGVVAIRQSVRRFAKFMPSPSQRSTLCVLGSVSAH